MRNFIQYIVPYKKWSYFATFYRIRKDIQNNPNFFSSSRLTIYGLCFIVLLNSSYNFWLMLQPTLSPSAAMMGFAVFHANDMPTTMYLVPSASEVLSLIQIYLLYFMKNSDKNISKKGDAFLLIYDEPSLPSNLNSKKNFLKGEMNSRQMLLALINFLQMFTVVIGIFEKKLKDYKLK